MVRRASRAAASRAASSSAAARWAAAPATSSAGLGRQRGDQVGVQRRAAAATSTSVTGPGVTCRRSDASGNVPSSTAGSDSGSSVGVGACTTGRVGGGTGRPRAVDRHRPASPSTPDGRAPPPAGSPAARRRARRSPTGRPSASRPPTVAQHDRAGVVHPGQQPPAGVDRPQRRQRQQQHRVELGQRGPDRRRPRPPAAAAAPRCRTPPGRRRVRGRTAAAAPAPARRAAPARRPAPGTAATAARVSAAENRTPPVVECTAGSSVTASTAANPTPNRPTLAAVPLGRGPQRRQRLHAGRVQRRTGVRRASSSSVHERQPQPSGHAGPGRRVGRVLRQLDHQPVPVRAVGQVLLGVGVLAEPGRRRGPGREHPVPDRGGAEGVAARSAVAERLGLASSGTGCCSTSSTVSSYVGGGPPAALDQRLGVRAAAVVGGDHRAVPGRELVAADAEHRPQRARRAAGRSRTCRSAPGACVAIGGVRAAVAVVPALGGLVPAVRATSPGAGRGRARRRPPRPPGRRRAGTPGRAGRRRPRSAAGRRRRGRPAAAARTTAPSPAPAARRRRAAARPRRR